MKTTKEYRKLNTDIKFIQIKKDNEEIFIINEKYKNKKLECSGKQTTLFVYSYYTKFKHI